MVSSNGLQIQEMCLDNDPNVRGEGPGHKE
jgi:hypothetical protein